MDGSNWGNNPKVTIAYCCCSGAKMHLTLLRPMVCNPPGSSVQGISQARILEWVAIFFSRGSSLPRDQTQVSLPYHLSHQRSPSSS